MTAQREGGVIDSLGYDKNSQMTSYSLGGAVSTLTYDERVRIGVRAYY
ncbi:MAG: hypothetical protein H0X34_11890 [Chthoniobacterales bacterium]|jgi:hypothetical protein|nr:hypothetical protein [Chthoniobacterales bacterium]